WAIVGGRCGFLATDLTLLLGGGTVSFHMPARLAEPASPNNRVQLDEGTFAVVTRLGLGGELRLFGEDDGVGLIAGASFRVEQYYAEAQVPGSTSGSVGFADAFYSALVHVSVRYLPR